MFVSGGGWNREMRNKFSFVWVLWFDCWSLWLAVYLADLKNKVRCISKQVEKYRGESVRELSGWSHARLLGYDASKLVPRGAGSSLWCCVGGPPPRRPKLWGHQELAQPVRTSWNDNTGNHFKGETISNWVCKEIAEWVTLAKRNQDEHFQTRCLTSHRHVKHW